MILHITPFEKTAVSFTMACTVSLVFHLTEICIQFFDHAAETNLSLLFMIYFLLIMIFYSLQPWIQEEAGIVNGWIDSFLFYLFIFFSLFDIFLIFDIELGHRI